MCGETRLVIGIVALLSLLLETLLPSNVKLKFGLLNDLEKIMSLLFGVF